MLLIRIILDRVLAFVLTIQIDRLEIAAVISPVEQPGILWLQGLIFSVVSPWFQGRIYTETIDDALLLNQAVMRIVMKVPSLMIPASLSYLTVIHLTMTRSNLTRNWARE
jgi:hypothetical protein